MSVLWQKVWFDLWQNRTRTALAVLSIAAGVFAVGAIFGMIDLLLSGMDAAHRSVDPSHVNIILRNPVDRAVVDRLAETDGLAGIEPANQISVRYRFPGDGSWENGILVMRPDYEDQRYDRLALAAGAWPAEGQVGVERLTDQYYELDTGQDVIFETEQGQLALPIGGQIRHPFVPPPPFGGQAHFFVSGADLSGFGLAEGRYNQLLLRVEPYSLDLSRQVAGDVRQALAEQGVGVVVSVYQDPDRHWGRMFVEGVNLVLSIMAVVSLVMSVILILNSLMALITQQTDQIGVIKAVGGRRWTIVRVYLSGALVYGLLSLLIALPLALIFAFLMSRWFLNLFNVDLATFAVSGRSLGLMLAASLIAPLLAALWPVLRGASITVREAIATYGLGNDFGSSRLDRWVDALGGRFLPATYAAALGNLFRRKGRLALTLLVLVVAGVMFIVVMSLISSTNLTLDNEMARQNYDLRIGFNRDQPAGTVEGILDESADVTGYELWFNRNATILRQGERVADSAGLGVQLTGLPAGSDFYQPIIAAGRWLEAGDGQPEGRRIVISEETAVKNGIAVGDSVTLDLGDLGSAQWEVIGLYRVVYGTGFVTEPLYAPREAVLATTGLGQVATSVLVRTGAGTLDQNTAAAERIKSVLKSRGIDTNTYTTTVKLAERAYADNQFGSVSQMLLSLAMLVASVGGIGLMGALGISVVERRRETGVLRAVGATSRVIIGLFITEGVLQGVMSWFLAVPLALLLAPPLTRLLGQTMIEVDLDFAFDWTAVLLWLGLVLLVAVLAAIVPARKAANISVRESLAYG